MKISVGARGSNLSKRQVEEVLEELQTLSQKIHFIPTFVKTRGDKDLTLSLRKQDNMDCFTNDIDRLVLEKKCRIAIHSAKDLPVLMKGLQLIALTKGKDPSDVLVLREGETIDTLPKNGVIGSSSERRDAMVQKIREDLQCIEIRGTIERRLEKLFTKEIEGLVVAKAALLRLRFTDLNEIPLEGEIHPLQGKLAIVAREEDEEMAALFSVIDFRRIS